jgi:hypothetical protein
MHKKYFCDLLVVGTQAGAAGMRNEELLQAFLVHSPCLRPWPQTKEYLILQILHILYKQIYQAGKALQNVLHESNFMNPMFSVLVQNLPCTNNRCKQLRVTGVLRIFCIQVRTFSPWQWEGRRSSEINTTDIPWQFFQAFKSCHRS